MSSRGGCASGSLERGAGAGGFDGAPALLRELIRHRICSRTETPFSSSFSLARFTSHELRWSFFSSPWIPSWLVLWFRRTFTASAKLAHLFVEALSVCSFIYLFGPSVPLAAPHYRLLLLIIVKYCSFPFPGRWQSRGFPRWLFLINYTYKFASCSPKFTGILSSICH
jgi:hypothetical protein